MRLTRTFAVEGPSEVVIVDLHKLLACADRDDTDYVLKPVGEWHEGKIRGIREFLDPHNDRIPQIPYVTVSTRRVPGLAGWLRLAREGVVAFHNGQHRTRYLAYAGALWLPVEVLGREAPLLRELCGAQSSDDGDVPPSAQPRN